MASTQSTKLFFEPSSYRNTDRTYVWPENKQNQFTHAITYTVDTRALPPLMKVNLGKVVSDLREIVESSEKGKLVLQREAACVLVKNICQNGKGEWGAEAFKLGAFYSLCHRKDQQLVYDVQRALFGAYNPDPYSNKNLVAKERYDAVVKQINEGKFDSTLQQMPSEVATRILAADSDYQREWSVNNTHKRIALAERVAEAMGYKGMDMEYNWGQRGDYFDYRVQVLSREFLEQEAHRVDPQSASTHLVPKANAA